VSWVDITAAVGTAASAVIALGLGLRAEYRAIRTEREQRELLAMAQATRVGAWISSMIYDEENHRSVVLVRIRNGSNMPVYRLELKSKIGVQGTFVRHVDAMGPDEIRELTLWIPGNRRSMLFAPELLFTDIADRRWYRDRSGNPREIVGKEKNTMRFDESGGAYSPKESHPSLRLPKDDYESGGKIVSR
jgi:hypothetical protein